MSLSLIPVAYAAIVDGPTPGGAEGFQLIFLLVVFAAFFYFILWRPQSKRAKEHRDLVSNLAKGDEVITAGGILGRINKTSEDFVVIAIAEGVDIVVQKSSIAATVPKGTMNSMNA